MALLLPVPHAQAVDKQAVGWVEKILLTPANIVIHAKLDTGADYSSINATNLKRFKQEGEDWVRLSIRNRYGHIQTIERQVVRTAKIKRHGSESLSRSVIRMGLCIGSKYLEEEFTLANRSNFDYQVLVGRSFLAGNLLIDPAVTYTAEPNCEGHMKEPKKVSSKSKAESSPTASLDDGNLNHDSPNDGSMEDAEDKKSDDKKSNDHT